MCERFIWTRLAKKTGERVGVGGKRLQTKTKSDPYGSQAGHGAVLRLAYSLRDSLGPFVQLKTAYFRLGDLYEI